MKWQGREVSFGFRETRSTGGYTDQLTRAAGPPSLHRHRDRSAPHGQCGDCRRNLGPQFCQCEGGAGHGGCGTYPVNHESDRAGTDPHRRDSLPGVGDGREEDAHPGLALGRAGQPGAVDMEVQGAVGRAGQRDGRDADLAGGGVLAGGRQTPYAAGRAFLRFRWPMPPEP